MKKSLSAQLKYMERVVHFQNIYGIIEMYFPRNVPHEVKNERTI